MSTPTDAEPPVLTVHEATKRFAGVQALRDVSVDFYPGEVHALVGENGAGKSTLIKLITGVYQLDSGQVRLRGEEVNFPSPRAAQHAGIATIYQEVHLAPQLSVARNFFLGRELTRFGSLDLRRMNRERRGAGALRHRGRRPAPAGRTGPGHPADGGDRPRGHRPRPRSSSWTSRPPRWSPARSTSCSRSSSCSRPRASPSCTSRTSWTRCSGPATRSPCCATASWSATGPTAELPAPAAHLPHARPRRHRPGRRAPHPARPGGHRWSTTPSRC